MPKTPTATATKFSPSANSRMPSVKRGVPVIDVGADQAEQQAEHHHGERLDDRAMRQRDRRDEADDHQREIFGRAELAARSPVSGGAKSATRKVATVPAKNEPIAAVASAAPARPLRAIW